MNISIDGAGEILFIVAMICIILMTVVFSIVGIYMIKLTKDIKNIGVNLQRIPRFIKKLIFKI